MCWLVMQVCMHCMCMCDSILLSVIDTATVEDLIGLTFWKYLEEREPIRLVIVMLHCHRIHVNKYDIMLLNFVN